MREINPLLADFQLFAAHLGIGRLELTRRAVAQQAHLALLQASRELFALVARQRALDAVLVLRAQLDRFIAGLFELADDGFEVPVLEEIVGDTAKMQHGPPFYYAARQGGDD